MRITDLELVPVRVTREMGLRGPSDPEKAVSECLLVFLHSDAGVTGLGEMSDVGFAIDPATRGALRTRLMEHLSGRDPFELAAIQRDLNLLEWEHQVLCGIDIALHDLLARALDIPLYQFLGGKLRDRIPFAYPLACCRLPADVDANLGRIARLQEAGHRAIRYYFGQDLDLDERFLGGMRNRWGDEVELVALDASGRFEPDQAVAAIHRFAPYGPGLVESPIAGRHHAPAAQFDAVRGQVDVAIGEHIADAATAASLHASVDVFNVGVGYAGITACRKIFAMAEVLGVKALAGSTVELSVGTAARAHVIAATPNIAFPCYPSGPLIYQDQVVVQRVCYEAGHILVPDGPGLGVEVDQERLRQQRLD